MSETTDFLTPRIVTHPRLSRETTWVAMGDLALLDAAQFVPVILSRSLFAGRLEQELQAIDAAVRQGAVAVGGFISFPEKQAARRLAKYADLRLIRVLPHPLIDYPLTEHVQQRILAGKTLILSGIAGEDMTLTRANCVRANGWILEICGKNHTLAETPHTSAATPPSSVATLVVKKTTFARPTQARTQAVAPSPDPIDAKDDPAAIFL